MRPVRPPLLAAAAALLAVAPWARLARAQEAPSLPDPVDPAIEAAQEQEAEEPPEGFVPNEGGPRLEIGGYVDVGFADAGGNGSSFHPADRRSPLDYGSDAFAPAVNTRGDVASTDAGQRFTNGFLPRSVGIGGNPSFLLNTVSVDLRYGAPASPVLVFTRLQLVPRIGDRGVETRAVVEQAFGRVMPFASQELAIFVGKMDSVFGIEYLENQANIRTNITPSLLARYTTGPSIGGKLFFRQQIAPLWSALSLNVAATNNGPFVEPLQVPEASLTGRPVFTGRVGYELNLPGFQMKLGGSGLHGPRNDQHDPETTQRGFGADARLYLFGVSLSGEYVHIDQEQGPAGDKFTGLGPQLVASEFHVRGFWAMLALELPWSGELFRRTTLYARGEQREGWFEGFAHVLVRRLTTGFRLDLWDSLALKFEMLFNREIEGAPDVDNDVKVASAVWSF